ncbi:hypothetical protein AABD41_01630 [Staphylococcus pseudoxylosus]|uniref:hypothetical protein n=1 Tax=Staphylococcus pseudoxylosus TaxID=2282419 RepID=UPI00398B4B93
MINPNEKAKAISNNIIKDGIFIVKNYEKIEGKTIKNIISLSIKSMPATLFLTEDKFVYINTVYTDYDDEFEETLVGRKLIDKNDFKSELMRGSMHPFTLQKLESMGVIDINSIDEYKRYKAKQAKIDYENYQKELEYKRYIELKEKYESK